MSCVKRRILIVVKRLVRIGQRGVTALLDGTLVRVPMWVLEGTRTVSIGDVEATFDTSRPLQALVLQHSLRTERPVLADFVTELTNDDVVLDVGANYGLYSAFAAAVIDPGLVVAVEPYPPNIGRIERTHELNGASICVKPIALADTDGETAFAPPSYGRDITGTTRIRQRGDESNITVPTARTDTLIANGTIPEPTVVKIDVEGAEPLVLDGMGEYLASETLRVLYLEIHRGAPSLEEFGWSVADVYDCLHSHGFDTTVLQSRGDEQHVKAERKP
jgi:FkbM family methyltransferase